MPRDGLEVPAEKLRWECDPDVFTFETTEELSCDFVVIGQERAVKSLELGLAVESPGYNVYVQGLTGTGRETTVRCIAEEVAASPARLTDKCYVHNFHDPDRPKILYLSPGMGTALRKDMEHLVEAVRRLVPAVLESEEFIRRRKEIMRRREEEGKRYLRSLQDRIKKDGLVMLEQRAGPLLQVQLAALVDGKPRSAVELREMLSQGEISQEEFDRIQRAEAGLAGELEALVKRAGELEREVHAAIEKLVLDLGSDIVTPRIDELKEKYPSEVVLEYLEQVRLHMLENLESFHGQPAEGGAAQDLVRALSDQVDPFYVYRVNVLVDNRDATRRPVIVETHPTYKNLFGTVERRWDRHGLLRTDFTRIKGGSFVRADGGVLVLSLLDVFVELGIYGALKRALKTNSVDILGYDPLFFFSQIGMKPEPVAVNVKVVLIGDALSYQLLYELDPDFKKLFKVKADFATRMDRSTKALSRYAHFIRRTTEVEKLLAFERGAVARVVEEGLRYSGRQNKLSTRFSEIADLIRESTYWAREAGSDNVRREDVERAVSERVDRLNLVETKLRELVASGILNIEVDGSRVGQVNGLSVYDVGDYRFGAPAKITASVAVGRKGIVNIEREAELSENVHSKGVLILTGYVRSRFPRQPLSLTASIGFEQTYTEVAGDDASLAELCTLLSSLAGAPLRQDVAVTGSINQKGEVQAIVAVNEKVEGFYDVCRERGLTGNQGVIIPVANVEDLMLRDDVVEAITRGDFHLYSVRHADEAIELLTGIPAGAAAPDGTFPPGSLHAAAHARLREMARSAAKFLPRTAPAKSAV